MENVGILKDSLMVESLLEMKEARCLTSLQMSTLLQMWNIVNL